MLDWRQGFANGTPVIQYPNCNTGEWEFRRMTYSGAGILRNTFTGRCLDARNPSGGAPGVGAVLQQWDCIGSGTEWNARNQLWWLG